MRRLVAVAVARLGLAGLALAGLPGLAGPAQAAPATTAIEIAFDRTEVATVVGTRFTVYSRITNPGPATDRIFAHLNVASLDREVYVDPEDWSSNRTQEVPSLPQAGDVTLSWGVQAVNAGNFDLYLVLLPNGTSSAGTGPLVVSPPVHVVVAGRRVLTGGGALPVVVMIPVLLGLAAIVNRYRVRAAR